MCLVLVGLFCVCWGASSDWLGLPDFAQAGAHCISIVGSFFSRKESVVFPTDTRMVHSVDKVKSLGWAGEYELWPRGQQIFQFFFFLLRGLSGPQGMSLDIGLDKLPPFARLPVFVFHVFGIGWLVLRAGLPTGECALYFY